MNPAVTVNCRCPKPIILVSFGLRYCGKCLSRLPVENSGADRLTAKAEELQRDGYRLWPRQ